MTNIPLIIPNFNQISYVINLINWWFWYHPESRVFILDNASTDKKTHDAYEYLIGLYSPKITVWKSEKNDCVENLRDYLNSDHWQAKGFEYYVISDPDIMPLPNTPANFLEIFKHAIDNYNFHHVGFGLKTDDIPEWNDRTGWIQGDENGLLSIAVRFELNGKLYSGFKAPIDTTFALYKKSNGGWTNPQTAEAWNNSLRLFQAYHLPWYIDQKHLNDEMKNYFSTARYRIPGVTSTGVNNYRPEQFREIKIPGIQIEEIKYPITEMVKKIKSTEIITRELEFGAIYNDEFPGFHQDYLVLHCLLKLNQPRTIFEIGTNMGTGTKIIKNAVFNASVFSLDLPTELADKSLQHPIKEGKGDRVGAHCKLPFTQLRGDSMNFNFGLYPCEAYYVDGEHDYEHPFKETTEILKQRPKLIVYHDSDTAPVYDGIVDAFKKSEIGKEYQLYRVEDTRIMFALKK